MNPVFRYITIFLRQVLTVGAILVFSLPAFSQDESYDYQEDSRNDQFVFDRREGTTPRLYKRNVSEKQVTEWQEDDAFWYANKDFERKKKGELPSGYYTPVARRPWFQTLLWILIVGGFISVLIWFLAENKVGLFNRRKEAITDENGEEIPEDIHTISFQKEIDQAIRSENFRLAVRLMFLRTLKTMTDKNIVQYKQDKTNLDYLMELQDKHYYRDFFQVVRNYEYSWYGLFEVNSDAFASIKKESDQLDKILYRA